MGFGDWSTKKKIIVGIVAFVAGAAIGVPIFWRFAIKAVDTEKADPNAINREVMNTGTIEGGMIDGQVVIESSVSVSNLSDVTHFLTILDATYPTDADSPISLYFTNDVMTDPFTTNETTLMVAGVQDLTFPSTLPSSYGAELFNAGIFTDASNKMIGMFTFDDIDDTTLISQLSGSPGHEDVGGKITVSKSRVLQNNEKVVEKTSLFFEDIEVPSAPDAFLYLSINDDRSVDGDNLIPIDDAGRGRFVKTGTFVQKLDDDIDINLFTNGSFIVWCRRFGLFLGGGAFKK